MTPQLICVVGPTATGKTALGVWLAERYDGEVVSCDSMQLYRGMDIGTAKPTPEETHGVPHHMIDVAEPWEDFSAERYRREASACVDDILRRGRRPIVVGGTGLYLDALLRSEGYPIRATGWRQKLQAQFDAEGIAPLWAELEVVDPETARRLSPNDIKRVIRALEVWHETGRTLTDHNAATRSLPPRYTAVKLALSYADRADLYRRIDTRVDEMARQGLADEVERLLRAGVPEGCTAMQAIGYKELIPAVRGEANLSAALEQVKLRSRQYAKRQLTWFRRFGDIHWYFHAHEPNLADLRRVTAEKLAEVGIQ
ncbi:MAG: tRNA (adenosine(37)-N6)-dimethylallyltransferase MiaA [Oscillospiraceae bacterium]|nr:tRNA (adenosine(37)-N6)-dimethylallyltransferase MiaA [Oscillospiraceae bacterium]